MTPTNNDLKNKVKEVKHRLVNIYSKKHLSVYGPSETIHLDTHLN